MALTLALGNDLDGAIRRVNDIVMGYVVHSPVSIQLEWLVNGQTLKTKRVLMRKFESERIVQLKDELTTRSKDSAPDTNGKVILHLEKLKPGQRTCPNCNKKMRSDNIHRHGGYSRFPIFVKVSRF